MELNLTYEPALPLVASAAEVADLLERKAALTLIDVRTPAEFASAHIPGSYNVPLDLLPEHRDELRDTLHAPVVLICRTGNRAQQAERVLREADLTQIHILDGGITAWSAARKPINRGVAHWSIERQVRGLAGGLVLTGVLGGRFVWKPLTYMAAAIGAGLAYSAITDSCAMGMLLSKLPYNRGATCDMRAVIAEIAATSR